MLAPLSVSACSFILFYFILFFLCPPAAGEARGSRGEGRLPGPGHPQAGDDVRPDQLLRPAGRRLRGVRGEEAFGSLRPHEAAEDVVCHLTYVSFLPLRRTPWGEGLGKRGKVFGWFYSRGKKDAPGGGLREEGRCGSERRM